MKTIEEILKTQAERIGQSAACVEIALCFLPRLLKGFNPNSHDGKVAAEIMLQLRKAAALLTPNCKGQVKAS